MSHHTTAGPSSIICKVCGKHHRIFQCYKFLKMTPSERFLEVKKLHICFNCLKDGHGSQNCPSQDKCKQCTKDRNTLLHFGDVNVNRIDTNHQEAAPATNQQSNVSSSVTIHCTGKTNQVKSQVFLATAIIKVY